MTYYLISGLLGGLAHRWADEPWLAWLALALMWTGLQSTTGWRRALGLWVAFTLKESVAFLWLTGAASYFLGISRPEAAALAALAHVLCGTLRWLPMYVIWRQRALIARFRGSWLVALGLAAGDILVGEAVGFGLGDILYSQWKSELVRSAIHWYGWWPTLILLTIFSVEAVEALRRPGAAPVLSVCFAGGTVIAAPHGSGDSRAVAAVGAVQIRGNADRAACPSGVEILVWPEGYLGQVIRVDEGEAEYEIKPPCTGRSSETTHIAGMVTIGEEGPQNSAVIVDSTSTVRQARAKRLLVPFAETNTSYLSAGEDATDFARGRAAPVLTAGDWTVGVLICFEVLSRRLAAEAVAAGAEILVVIASDLAFVDDAVAQEQWIGALSLRSAEFGLPSARASYGGRAVLIDSRGNVEEVGPISEGVAVITRTAGAQDG